MILRRFSTVAVGQQSSALLPVGPSQQCPLYATISHPQDLTGLPGVTNQLTRLIAILEHTNENPILPGYHSPRRILCIPVNCNSSFATALFFYCCKPMETGLLRAKGRWFFKRRTIM